ncbi:uncharacterized protein LOC117285186 [Fukomys damarensis]|uniref:uncharacterized protein LOC117285186 n=1 Tax=Fukomys damarensis TaxID=885580 RepID=UPI001455C606|nr:uncharacterized protein LOC117285186 [Fukomys damarensis]
MLQCCPCPSEGSAWDCTESLLRVADAQNQEIVSSSTPTLSCKGLQQGRRQGAGRLGGQARARPARPAGSCSLGEEEAQPAVFKGQRWPKAALRQEGGEQTLERGFTAHLGLSFDLPSRVRKGPPPARSASPGEPGRAQVIRPRFPCPPGTGIAQTLGRAGWETRFLAGRLRLRRSRSTQPGAERPRRLNAESERDVNPQQGEVQGRKIPGDPRLGHVWAVSAVAHLRLPTPSASLLPIGFVSKESEATQERKGLTMYPRSPRFIIKLFF